MSGSPPIESASQSWARASGAALLVGAGLLALKSLAILITGDQPPLLFEVAPLFLGLGVLLLPSALDLTGLRRGAVLALGLTAAVAGAASAITEIMGEVLDAALGTSSLAAIIGAVVSGWHPGRDGRKRALRLVAPTAVLALIGGGMLSEIDERLLEIGLLCYAAVWALAGYRLLVQHPVQRLDQPV